jgi:hypothetical protein
MKIKKKAQSHIEVIISLILFVGVIIFLLLIINPLATGSKKTSIIDEIQKIIVTNLSSEVGKLSVIVKSSGDCYSLADVSEYGDKFVEVKESARVYAIYFSDDFPSGVPSCAPPINYTLGAYSKDNILIYERIKDLASNYNLSYKETKESLGITNNFAFSFKPIGGVIDANLSVSRDLPRGIEREAKEYPVRVLITNGTSKGVKEFMLNIMSWE